MIRPCFPCVSTDKQGQALFDMASGLSEPGSKLTAYLHAALLPSAVRRMGIELRSVVPHRYYEEALPVTLQDGHVKKKRYHGIDSCV